MSPSRSLRIVAAVVVLLVASLLPACGGGSALPAAPGGAEQPGAPGDTPAAGEPAVTPAPAGPPAADAQSRISDSYNRTLGTDEGGTVLGSCHVEISMDDPTWDAQASSVVNNTWTMSADLQADDVHLVYSGDGETTEGWIMGQDTEEPESYELVQGEVQEAFMLPLVWLNGLIPVFPLVVAALGPTSQGGDTIDGRAAERYGVDSANAPTGAMGLLGGFINITASRGTVWVDRETGALLKTVLDYEQRFTDPDDPDTVLGTGNGHVEIAVSQVGRVTVEVP